MGDYSDETNRIRTLVIKDCQIVASDVDTAAPRIRRVERVIIKKRIQRLNLEQPQSFIALLAYSELQSVVILAKFLREENVHALFLFQPAYCVVHIGKRRREFILTTLTNIF